MTTFVLSAAGGNFEPVKEEDDEYDLMIREKKKLENAQSSEKWEKLNLVEIHKASQGKFVKFL